MQVCSTPLATTEIQIKTTMKYHFTPVRVAIINKSKKCWRGCRENGTLLVGMQTGAATVVHSMEFPQKTKNGTAFSPSNSTAGIIP